jgi:integrase
MRKHEPRPGQIGNQWLSKKPGREGDDHPWCRTYYDDDARQVRRYSLGTADFQKASIDLAEWVVLNDRPVKGRPDQVPIERVLLSYYDDHRKKLASGKTARLNFARFLDHFGDKMVSDLTPHAQRKFHDTLREKGLKNSSIDRILEDVSAALRYAVKYQELGEAPHIFSVESPQERETRDPLGRPISIAEWAAMIDASAQDKHLLRFTVLMSNTLGRPAAILDLRPEQFDRSAMRVNLNAPGRIQNSKRRPIVPVTRTLLPWLNAESDPTAYYVQYKGGRVTEINRAWNRARERAGLDADVVPYSLRHTLPRIMREREIPLEQIAGYIGHQECKALFGHEVPSHKMTKIYAPDSPDYLKDAAAVIDDTMCEIRSHLKKVNLDCPGENYQCINPRAQCDSVAPAGSGVTVPLWRRLKQILRVPFA